MVLQERDFNFLTTLFESRAMTLFHAAYISFGGHNEAAKKRLQKLKSAGYVRERKRHSFEPSILLLTSKGMALLQKRGILAEYPLFDLPVLVKRADVSDSTLQHELEIMDVKAAFHRSISLLSKYSFAEFSTWPLLNQFEARGHGYGGRTILVKPDGLIRVIEKGGNNKLHEHVFFLEHDRSSEAQERLVNKAVCYVDYFKSGGYALKKGADRSAYKEYPFRVLMVFKSAERRNITAERLLQSNPPILTQVCLSTIAEVMANPLGAIWFSPADYRNAIKGTPFDSAKNHEPWGYKRRIGRDLIVEKNVCKWKILADEHSN